MTLHLRTLMGLGDAVYAYPIVKELLNRDKKIELLTWYPDVFKPLMNIGNLDIQRGPIAGSYSKFIRLAYERDGSNFYETMARHVLRTSPPFYLHVLPDERAIHIMASIRNHDGRPVCLIKEPHAAHCHRKTNDYSMAPHIWEMQNWLTEHRKDYYFISCEHDDNYKARLVGIDLRLKGLTVPTYLGLCAMSDLIVSQVGHLVPISQSLDKPLKLFMPEKRGGGWLKIFSASQVLVKPELAEVFG